MKLAFLFRTAPHGNTSSREGLDALLAATAFCDEEEIGVFFIDDGVLNLLDEQKPEGSMVYRFGGDEFIVFIPVDRHDTDE